MQDMLATLKVQPSRWGLQDFLLVRDLCRYRERGSGTVRSEGFRRISLVAETTWGISDENIRSCVMQW